MDTERVRWTESTEIGRGKRKRKHDREKKREGEKLDRWRGTR